MESFDSTIIVIAVALLAWYFGQSNGGRRVRQEVEHLRGQVERLEEKVERRSTKGGSDFGVFVFLMGSAFVVALLVLGI